ncbi:MAG: hypothetical protein WBY98_15930, partial [Candidatus Sulfotelmatobacter sp.]
SCLRASHVAIAGGSGYEGASRLIMGPTRVSDIMGKGETRCPYCVVGDNLYPMKVLRNGRLICEKCGHIVFPGDGAFRCPCPRCIAVNMSPRVRTIRRW